MPRVRVRYRRHDALATCPIIAADPAGRKRLITGEMSIGVNSSRSVALVRQGRRARKRQADNARFEPGDGVVEIPVAALGR
jgi:hypothetical protein